MILDKTAYAKNLAEAAYIVGPASPALAGPLFSESTSLVSFPDCISTHVLLKYACIYDVQLLAIWRICLQ